MAEHGTTEIQHCAFCSEVQDANHPLCLIALRNLALGYCTECGEDVEGGELHDPCVLAQAAKVRPSLLEPPSPDELACLARLADAAEAELRRIEADPDWTWKQSAPWN